MRWRQIRTSARHARGLVWVRGWALVRSGRFPGPRFVTEGTTLARQDKGIQMLSMPLSRRRLGAIARSRLVGRPGVRRPTAVRTGNTFTADTYFADPECVESDYARLARRGR